MKFPIVLSLLFVTYSNGQNISLETFEPIGKSFPDQRYRLGTFLRENPEDYFLPRTMIPTNYQLVVEPFIELEYFTGEVKITGYCDQAIEKIVLHALNLKLKNINVIANEEEHQFILQFDKEKEFVIIQLEKTLMANTNITVDIKYEGQLHITKNRGFYIAKYKTKSGKEEHMATTHMEPTNAREVLPCFDEPALKATFEVRVIRPKNFNCKTNAPIIKVTPHNDEKDMDIFHKTPLMSTYLLAIVVSRFATIEATYPDQTTHQLHGDVDDLQNEFGDLALFTSRQVISAMEAYTGVRFDLPKIGQVAIPAGYFGGAMENWGLVVYGEESLLFKPHIDGVLHRQGVVSIIAHEYAHQWFGNLVGPAQWAYTWLNEGFATFFTMRLPSILYPEWRYEDQYAWKIPSAMGFDASAYTRPMTLPVGKPENIAAMFDVIAYDKSACVLRMFEHVLGPELFQKAINVYLNKRAYNSATANDVIAAFETVSKEVNIREAFDSWHLQAGFPLVTAIRNYTTNTLTLRQERFHSAKDANQTDELWHIPINFFTAASTSAERASTKPDLWLDKKEITIDLDNVPLISSKGFIVLNKHYTGYYRVNYNIENWNRIIADAHRFVGMDKNQVQLLEDAFTFTEMGKLTYDIPWKLANAFLTNQDDYLLVRSFMPHFDELVENFYEHETYPRVQKFLINMLRKSYRSYSKVQFDGNPIQTLIRIELLPRLCRLGHQQCLNEMNNEMFKDYVLTSPNLQESVLCAGMMNTSNSVEKFNTLLKHIELQSEEEVRSRFTRALFCTKAKETGRMILDWIVQPETKPISVSTISIIYYFISDYDNAKIAFNYYLENFTVLAQRYNLSDMKTFFRLICGKIYSEKYVDKIDAFIASSNLTEEQVNMLKDAEKLIQANVNKTTVQRNLMMPYFEQLI